MASSATSTSGTARTATRTSAARPGASRAGSAPRGGGAPRDNGAAGRNGVARWASIAAQLRQRIVDGQWKGGDALPAEAALAAEHGVALGTMRAAIQALADEGLVDRLHGRGTFVRGGLAGGSLSRFFRWSGDAGGTLPGSRVLSVRRVSAPRDVWRALFGEATNEGERASGASGGSSGSGGSSCSGDTSAGELLRIVRLRLRDDRPLLHETIHLPLSAFGPLASMRPDEFPPLMYPLYAQRCGVTVHRALDDLAFERLVPAVARQLRLPSDAPGIRVTRVAFDLAGRAVEHRVTRGNAEDFRYRAEVR